MNNLKRVLSLGLVGAMLSGMMIMGASAAKTYTDVEDIVNIEAVEIMGALNIINGKDDGSFSPEENVTRSQMAKMIAVAMNGGKEPNFGVKTTPSFSDTKGHWAETFIEYCYDMKIINGRGDGTFDPDGNVTGVEAAKMVLSALGYDAVAYQLTGPAWDSNVNKQATLTCEPSLYDTVENTVMSQPITRDVAAQIIWNGMQNKTVTVSPDTTISSGEVTNKFNVNGKVFLNVHYGAQVGFGVLEANDKTEALTKGHIKLSGFTLDEVGATSQGNVDFPWDTDLSLIGEKVKVIFKDGKQDGKKNQPSKNDTIYGVFNANETAVVEDVVSNIGKVEDAKDVLKIDGTEYKANATVDVIWNYDTSHKVTKDSTGKRTTGSDLFVELTKVASGKNGDAIKVVMDEDGDVKTVYVTKSTLQEVTAVSSDKVTVTGVGTIKKADHDVYDGVQKNDLVVVTTLYNPTDPDSDDAFNVIEKAEVITGTVDKYKLKESVTVDGTLYKIYGETDLALKTTGKWKASVEAGDGSNLIGKEVELYMVNGRVGAVKVLSEDATNYSVILGKDGISSTGAFANLKLQVLAADGTKTIITVSDDSAKTRNEDYAEGDIVTYDVNKDGTATVYIKQKAAAMNSSYSKDTKQIVAGGNTYMTAADCVVFVKDTAANKTKANTIRNLKAFTGTAGGQVTVVTDSDRKAVAVYMTMAGTPSGAGSNRVYGIVSADNGTIKIDNTNYRSFIVNVNGEEYTVNQKEGQWKTADADHKISKGKIVSFEPTSDNLYEDATSFTLVKDGGAAHEGAVAHSVWVKEYDAEAQYIMTYSSVVKDSATGIFKGSDGATYAVDSDVKVYFVDVDNDTSMESGSVTTLDAMTGYKSAYLLIKDSKVIAIIAEVSGAKNVTD